MTPFGVIGATYAVTAVVNDPLNPLPSGVVSENSGDQATLSGILDTSLWPGTGTPGVTVVSNTVPASWFENTYRVK